MKLVILENYEELSKASAKEVIEIVKTKPTAILGLATGSTPVGLYKELIKACERKEISFKNVKTVNLDEYYPISHDNNQSYRYFMNDNLFNHIDIDIKNTQVPNGEALDPDKECERYEEYVASLGGADIQVLGIGNNGHIAFNEPMDDKVYLKTHLVSLTENTIEANARFFKSKDEVPTRALTMGIGTILSAKKIIILISGKAKHKALMALLDADFVDSKCPASYLKFHKDVIIFADKDAYNG